MKTNKLVGCVVASLVLFLCSSCGPGSTPIDSTTTSLSSTSTIVTTTTTGTSSSTTSTIATTTSTSNTTTTASSTTTTTIGPHALTNIFLLHHSVGNNLIEEGAMKSVFSNYNTTHGTNLMFWDHGYNTDGLRNPNGNYTGTNYAVPADNTNPDGYYDLWTSVLADWTATRTHIMSSHEVIAFKSCFPASAILDSAMLQQYKDWYLAMRNYFDQHTEKLFIVMSTPPLHRLATDTTEATNARAFANWLKTTYVSGHANVVCFDLFDYLAEADNGTAAANMLKYDYELDHGSSDSHPNIQANQTVGPVLALFLINAALSY